MAYDKKEDADRLKAIYERVVKVGRGESREDFGRRSGLGKAANVGHYLNGKNNLTVDVCRRFATHIPCKIEDFSPHWARVAQAVGQLAADDGAPHNQGGKAESSSGDTEGRASATSVKMPLLSWGRIDLMLEKNEDLLGTDGIQWIDAEGEKVGPKTKVIEMPDDSMNDRIQRGDRLVVEPGWEPEPGEIVVLRDKTGAVYVRRYKFVKTGHFIAEPANTRDYQPLDSVADGPLEKLGVVVSRREFLAKRMR